MLPGRIEQATSPAARNGHHATTVEDGEAMARNSELVRQWEILREIDGARNGISIPKLAALRGVHTRTIRRDLDALGRAGFSIWDDKTNGTSMWKLRAKPFARLEETGLGLIELCALYFSRTLVDTLAGAPLHDDLERAFVKLERALPSGCRRFLDRLPTLMKAKTAGRKRRDERKLQDVLARAVDASLARRRLAMRYASVSSARTKDYVVEPLRLVYAFGGIYLQAFVPEYNEVRTFSVERIRTLAVMDEQFEPKPMPAEAFPDSLGAYTGKPERVEIEFSAEVAEFVREREWHKSQEIEERADGSIVVRLNVCLDRPLKQWILGFGPAARVISPEPLAAEILESAEGMRARYAPRLRMLRMQAAPNRRASHRATLA
jgi:predicted DNA-binding transcriptional regulator YafY